MTLFAKLALLTLPLVGGCSATSAMASRQQGGDEALIERVAAAIDYPEKVFGKAGYSPVWTAERKEASGRLPKGLSAVPQEARVWEEWFREELTDGGKRLSTAELLRIKKTVIETVASDPACRFKAPCDISEAAASVESARRSALRSLGVANPSSALTQMTRMDAVTSFVKGRWNPGSIRECPELYDVEQSSHRYPTANEMLAGDYRLNCARSDLLAMYLIRKIENSQPSGLKVGAVYIFLFDPSGRMDLHGNVVGRISLPGGRFAHLYYDPVPTGRGSMNRVDLNLISTCFGPLDRASMERKAALNCVAVTQLDERARGDGKRFVSYNHILGESWPQFGLGNFDRAACFGSDWAGMQPGRAPFETWLRSNLPKIAALERAVDDAYEGR